MLSFYRLRSELSAWANTKLGWRLTYNTPDRKWLETWVYRNCYNKRVLSIGTSWYTMLLPEIVPCYWTTVDVTMCAERLAITSDRHYTTDLTDKTQCLGKEDYYDVVILNGVLGFGVNTPTAASEMISKLCKYLQPGGLLLIGYNDRPGRSTFSVEETVPQYMTLLSNVLVDPAEHSMHTYLEYQKPLSKSV